MVSNFLTDALVVIAVLGVMIFVHELGHFMAARWFGIRVLIFSLGFGKRLFGFKWAETDCRVSALPFGGYVKMAGDDPSEVRQGDPGEFLSRPRWQRFIVVVMGPAMNVTLAVLLLAGLYRFHFPKPAYHEQPARVGGLEQGSPAAQAGILPDDLIVRFGNLGNPKWEDIEIRVITSVGEPISLQVLRAGERRDLTVTPRAEGPSRIGYVGWYPYVPSIIEKVEPGLPASQAGLRPGDQILAIDGRPVLFSPHVTQILQASEGKRVELTLLREGREFRVPVTPVYGDVMGEKKWRIGVSFRSNIVVRRLPWKEALVASVRDNVRNCLATFDVLGKIITRRMSARSLAGPIGIAQLSGDAYRAGFPELLMLISFISLQLGIFNLLPIPILDGGVILLLLVEGLIRHDLSLEIKERFVQVGVFFLLLLAVFVMYNDLVKTFRPF